MVDCFFCKREVTWMTDPMPSPYGVDDLKSPPPKMSDDDVICEKCGQKLKDEDKLLSKEMRQQQLSKKAAKQKKMKSSDAGGFVTESEQKLIDNEKWAWDNWYLLPILLSWIGGLIGFLVLRKENPLVAKYCLYIGIGLTPVYLVLAVLVQSFAIQAFS